MEGTRFHMLNPRHLLILLGFFAQGMIWDSPLILVALFFLWFAALRFLKDKVRISVSGEGLALVLGCLISVAFSRLLQQSWHFFLGDGLILLQLVRLIRPLNKREKLTSIIIAAFHFSVLCTLAPNIRFVVLYVAALFLVPGALKELNASEPLNLDSSEKPESFRLLPSSRVCLWLLLGSAFVFISFPRFTGSPLQLRESLLDHGSLLDSILDPRNSGKANSKDILLQIEGDSLRYLRCLVLSKFDGVRWSAVLNAPVKHFDFVPENELASGKYKKRVVYVKSSQYLGHVIPVDGPTVWVKGNFFSRPMINEHGVLLYDTMWTTGNNVYTNYINASPLPEALPARMRKDLTNFPPQSEALVKFVRERTAAATNLLQKARLLEIYLRDNFVYELGTPQLNRLQPVDDFIFNRKSGHCERFAASLALMFRMQGIPSRVVIGYVPTSRNLFNGRAQVRFADAHSWTEGYFEGQGWVTFDATPGPPNSGRGSDLKDLLDALDFAWYSHVVNFNGFAQHELIASSRQILSGISRPVWSGAASIALFVVLVLCAIRFGKFPALRWRRLTRFIKKTAPQAAARHRYEEMLQILEKKGFLKDSHQTPFEFMGKVSTEKSIAPREVQLITENFCSSYYGEKEIAPRDAQEVKEALARLKAEPVPE